LSKVCALCFIILILLPFTAPFQTFTVTHSADDGDPYDTIPKDLKDTNGPEDTLAPHHIWSLPSLEPDELLADDAPDRDQLDQHPLQHTNLRI
jgi:hypothetical protein